MKVCPNCGAAVPDAHKFCTGCGATVVKNTPSANEEEKESLQKAASQPVLKSPAAPYRESASSAVSRQGEKFGSAPPAQPPMLLQPTVENSSASTPTGQSSVSARTVSPLPPENRKPPRNKAYIALAVLGMLIAALIGLVIWAILTVLPSKASDDTDIPTISAREEVESRDDTPFYEKQPLDQTPMLGEDKVFNIDEDFMQTKPYRKVFSSGFYVVGIDLPEGVYTLTAKEGSGTVAAGESFAAFMCTKEEAEKFSQNYSYSVVYEYADLPNGTVLSISGGNIEFFCDAASDTPPTFERVENKDAAFKIKSGVYEIGRDIEPGVYNFLALEGGGNVFTDDYSLYFFHIKMSTSEADGGIYPYTQAFQNVPLRDGALLEVKSDVTLQLTPVLLQAKDEP